ncbi:MAG: hypothetical protein GY938_03035 [Ketobacter sp.]|nr:hypothetical protein [Ketobacter sp.]
MCISCGPLYYLSGGECLLGTIPNCGIYNTTANTCNECSSGFALVTYGPNSDKVCLEIDPDLNCTHGSVDRLTSDFSCSSCIVNYLKVATGEFQHSACFPLI